MPFYLAIKNIFSRKSSLSIILFISFAISLFEVSNAFFDGTGKGIEKTFVNSFTGDIVIRPKVDFPLSLMGDETPATGNFSEIPQIIPFSNVYESVSSFSEVKSVFSQLSASAVINTDGNHTVCVLFGVNTREYFENMAGIHLVHGKTFDESEKGIMLSEQMLSDIKENTGKSYGIGDSVQLLSGNGISYSLRAVPLTGIFSYEIESDVLQKICIVSPEVLREISCITDTCIENDSIENEKNDLFNFGSEIDDLFGSDFDFDEIIENKMVVEESEITIYSEEKPASTSWNFLICKTSDKPEKIAKKLNRVFKKNQWPVEAVTWRSAAGLSAMYLFWIHKILTVGIIVLLGVGFIIVNNTLTVSAMDRISETGTLRALGGTKGFIIIQFMCETMILTVLSGIIGIILGIFFNLIINALNITLSNSYLIQVFGGKSLKTVISISNFIKCFLLSVLLGIIGWIYPVKICMEVSPVQAMQRGV